jgi:hypothetical protein
VVLKVSQIRAHNTAILPESLVFPNEQLDLLSLRIHQLNEELDDTKQEIKGLEKDLVNLGKEKVSKKLLVRSLLIFNSFRTSNSNPN